ncbi:MAG: ATP-dependent helicase HrpB [Opitutales bacterium]|jgi:ATP-dependent helicase HrpB|nr:ATP-dependent helicase HrpB [Opitutales bacterium]MDP4659550.1 ATP-dependent helicase HrpB [Opitutales bacterium]MDP4775853.1 ATP-dependent helicase HrpB [Opitutales bacterium]MDP4787792.1 ATP-dependent helicase HrpB [Opitutales bacterium]MDP4861436.1 ATP-dependent helicase HrpB [Opitutales bacterium]
MKQSLPIDALQADLVAACGRVRRLVLRAPTGSGKSTRIPQMLLDLNLVQGQIVVLQPRRIAARLLAARIAQERGVRLGGEVGYQIRFERVESAQTRIKFVTEALLLRQMASDPELKGVGAVVFDEFHERNLHSDVALALARRLQETHRPDLLIMAMSATLDTEGVAKWLGSAETLAADGRAYPVQVEYTHLPRNSTRPIWDAAAEQVRRVLSEEAEGDILVFMPGSYEIMRTIGAVRNLPESGGIDILPLYGELPPEEQDRAVKPSPGRKVIVATNVAETSLTIPGVRAVVDAGLARIARFDPHRGIDTLLVEPVSQASAEQRAGRAGRTGPGRCIRLWSQTDHEARPLREVPEIKRVDLSETILLLLSSGWGEAATFPWYEKPDDKALQRALTVLADLGAVDAQGKLTNLGRRMSVFPAHPRYARMLLAAGDLDCVYEVCRIAGLAQGRDILFRKVDDRTENARDSVEQEDGSDFFPRLALLQRAVEMKFDADACDRFGVHGQAARQADQAARQFLRLAEGQGLPVSDRIADPAAVRRCLLLGFSDRLAVRLDAGTLRCALVHGRTGELRRESSIRNAKLLVAAEVDEIQARGGVTTYLSLATAIEEAWLQELFPAEFSTVNQVRYDGSQRRVVTRVERRFRDLVLEAKERDDAPSDAASRLLAEEVAAGRLELEKWDAPVDAWIRRVNFLSKHCPELGIPPFDEAARRMVIEEVCAGAVAYRDIRDRPVFGVVRGWLTHEQAMALESYCPEKIVLPRKKHPARIEYTEDGQAEVEATVQELYDFPGSKLRVCLGKVPMVVCIQSPARRTQQRTTDLDAFWKGSYEGVKKELRGRYPKHEWR